MTDFRILGARLLADAGFLRVDTVDVEAPDGAALERVVVRHPGAVAVVPMLDDRRALCVRQFRAATGGNVLEIPAGKRDEDGEAPEVTAHREIEEEIGFRAGRLVKLAEFWNSPGFCDEYSHLFLALDLTPLGHRHTVSPEEAAMTVEEIALGDVEALMVSRDLVDAKSILGLLFAREHLAGRFPGLTG